MTGVTQTKSSNQVKDEGQRAAERLVDWPWCQQWFLWQVVLPYFTGFWWIWFVRWLNGLMRPSPLAQLRSRTPVQLRQLASLLMIPHMRPLIIPNKALTHCKEAKGHCKRLKHLLSCSRSPVISKN